VGKKSKKDRLAPAFYHILNPRFYPPAAAQGFDFRTRARCRLLRSSRISLLRCTATSRRRCQNLSQSNRTLKPIEASPRSPKGKTPAGHLPVFLEYREVSVVSQR